MPVLEKLEPQKVFAFFEEITKIPRGSGNEKGISDYIVNFARERNLFYIQDAANNVYIRKPATMGKEHSPGVILQGHLDMVNEKNNDTIHDFICDPIDICVDGDFIKARGTTLGADNGIAVAYTLAALDADDIPHGPLEAVFTTDEEVGMNGATAFDTSVLQGSYFLNMDSEEEGEFIVGCCGGMRATIHLPIVWETVSDSIPVSITVKGLLGGHSGSDISLQRPNANKLMGRVLCAMEEKYQFRIASINGGLMDNAISRENETVVMIRKENLEELQQLIQEMEKTFLKEFVYSDKGISLQAVPLQEKVDKAFTRELTGKIITVLTLIPYGVATMSLAIPGLVESSSNIGIVKTKEKEILFSSAVRSNIASRKTVLYNEINAIAKVVHGTLTVRGEYPAWEFNPNAKLLTLFQQLYQEQYGSSAKVNSIHAGLECGIFSKKLPNVEFISFGPNMYDVHTPMERLSISSTARTWELLKKVLTTI